MTAAELITAARGWLGVPFLHQGRNRFGVDCVGLVEMILAEAGALPSDYKTPRNYSRLATGELLDVVERYCTRATRPEPGALVVFRLSSKSAPHHVGLITERGMLHASMTARKVIEHKYAAHWVRCTHSAWRFPGVIYE